ncbi:hypothetical protein BM221_005517 [Beauveria bassiana]|uniref:Uncharacterized protein n=1 Tax=Beauveria bassiana TaxID=176275 RepID=A0A2N6NNT0_BEABA|nr:hypothetical protein BM221_005517 [Beauveria bassiana]
MGNTCSCVPRQSHGSGAGMPPPRRGPVRQSAASRMTHSTAITDDITLVAQSVDVRTNIVKDGLLHENPLRCHPVQRPPDDKGKSVEVKPVIEVEEAEKQEETPEWSKRGGMLFSVEEVNSFFAGSAKLGTQTDANDEQVEMEEIESTKVRSDEPLPDPESLASGTNPWLILEERAHDT